MIPSTRLLYRFWLNIEYKLFYDRICCKVLKSCCFCGFFFIYGLFSGIHDPLVEKYVPSWKKQLCQFFHIHLLVLKKTVWYCFSQEERAKKKLLFFKAFFAYFFGYVTPWKKKSAIFFYYYFFLFYFLYWFW